MPKNVWSRAVQASVDPGRAKAAVQQLRARSKSPLLRNPSEEQARIVATLCGGSPALADQLLAHPEWIDEALDAELLQRPRRKQGLEREVGKWLEPALDEQDDTGALRRLREFKQRENLRIAARDLARLGTLSDIVLELSNVADVCLSSVLRICLARLTESMGRPWHRDAGGSWHPTAFCVLGLGKLGGQELNYSSDVDVLFVYTEEGAVFDRKPAKQFTESDGPGNHRFFTRLAEMFIEEVGRQAPEGQLFRIDLRLRPEGSSGPLVRSLTSYENYYAQWGETWERMMLIKARCVAGDTGLASEFLEMLQPFRFPRTLGERILDEIAGMKRRIEDEVVRSGELDRNVKLGRGGIREIEFFTQTLQLLHGGSQPFLQTAQTLPALEKLVQYKLVSRSDAQTLAEACEFLRDVEHRLQMEHNLQTHTLPSDPAGIERIAALMGFPSSKAFQQARSRHCKKVRAIYHALFEGGPEEEDSGLPRKFDGCEADWKKLLGERGFKRVQDSLPLLRTFVHGPGYVHVSPRTVELGRQLLPRLFEFCPPETDRQKRGAKADRPVLSDPDRVMARLDSFISAYGARVTLYETWAGNPNLFQLLLLLFDRSEFLAERAIAEPDLVEELTLSGRLRRGKSAEDTHRDLRYGLEDEDQLLWLRRYHEAEFMRIGLREILGLADPEQNLIELSNLADACLRYAMDVVLRRHRRRKPPFAIIGLGKLGGREINYGSDLDIVFVAPRNARGLHKLQPLAQEVMDMLSAETELGKAFATDARLRPDGETGLLVNSLDAFEDYYRGRARLWEIQTISRSRFIAGSESTGKKFLELANRLSDFSRPALPLAAWSEDWKQQIAEMRGRIEKERTPAGRDALAIKTGAGGIIDAEFIAQAACLEFGWHEPNTLKALERIAAEKKLPLRTAKDLIANYRELRRIEGILRRWSYAGETVLPEDPSALLRVAIRCGFTDTPSFMKSLQKCRKSVRAAYQQAFKHKP